MIAFDETTPHPVRKAQAESPEVPRTQPRYEIPIVDDEASMRGLLRIGMHQQGFSVWLAASGREAIDVYRRHRIDMVLLDVRMPGLDGPQTLAALQSLNPQVAVILKPFHPAEVAQLLWDQVSMIAAGPSKACGARRGPREWKTTWSMAHCLLEEDSNLTRQERHVQMKQLAATANGVDTLDLIRTGRIRSL
jgi:CheY-like chemotaxis protein